MTEVMAPTVVRSHHTSDANKSVAAISTTAGGRPTGQLPTADYLPNLANDTADPYEVFGLIRHLDYAVTAPRVDEITPPDRDAEILSNQQGVDRRLEPEGRVDPPR